MSNGSRRDLTGAHKIRSMGEDLTTAIVKLNRIKNEGSITYRLPSETLATIVSHLEDDKSLVAATQVCYFWREALLSFPHLWSHFTPSRNEERALVFLERSKSAPVSVDLTGNSGPSEKVKEKLIEIIERLISLRAVDTLFLSGFLAKAPPNLRNLDLVMFNWSLFVGSLTATSIDHPLFPYLTNLSLMLIRPPRNSPRMGDNLLHFLRNSPRLESVFFNYGDHTDIEFTTDEESTEAVPLHHLCSFTHETPCDSIHIGLFNRLSLPRTCNVVFTITDSPVNKRWGDAFPAPRDSSYFSDVRKVVFHIDETNPLTIKATFSNSSNMKISLNRRPIDPYPAYQLWITKIFLEFFAGGEMVRSVEKLQFKSCQFSLPPEYDPQDFTEPLRKLDNLKIIVLSEECTPSLFLRHPTSIAGWCFHVENLGVYPELLTHDQPRVRSSEWPVEGSRRSGTQTPNSTYVDDFSRGEAHTTSKH